MILRSNIARQRGMTLLELVFATAILGTTLLAIGFGAGKCFQGLSACNNLQAAVDLAEELSDNWRDHVASSREVKTESNSGEREINNRLYTWEQQVDATEDDKVFRSLWTIRWKEGGAEREKTFSTLILEPPARGSGSANSTTGAETISP